MKNCIVTAEQIAAYGCQLRLEEKSAATMEKYLHGIRAFSNWLGERPVTREAAAEWKICLLGRGYAPSTINAMLSALNGFFSFLGWDEYRVKFLRLQRRLFRDSSRELTKPEYQRLIAAARGQGRERLALLMETISSTGIRVSEVRYITKIRTVFLPGKLCRKLEKYAKQQKNTSGAIFRTRSGKELSRRQIWAELKGLCRSAGVEPSKVFPHNLRHLFAVLFYRASRDIAKLADLLGHSSIETTRIYLVSSGKEHRRQLDLLGLVQ